MADDVTDSDTSIAARKTEETADGSSQFDPAENHEESSAANTGEEAGSSEVHENGNAEQVESSGVPDDGGPDLATTEAPEDNGMKEADGDDDIPDNHAENVNMESSTATGLVDSSVTETVDLREGSAGNDGEDPIPDEPEIDQDADRLLGGSPPAEEDAGVSSTAQEELTEQDQSVPECSSGVADEPMETDTFESPADVRSETPDANVTESTTTAPKEEDSVVPDSDRDVEPAGPSEMVEQDARAEESVCADAESKMEVKEEKNNDSSESAVVPGEKGKEIDAEGSKADASKDSDLTETEPSETIKEGSGESKNEDESGGDVLMEDSEAKKSPGDAEDKAEKSPGDAEDKAEKSPGDAEDNAEKSPGDAEVNAEKSPGDSEVKADKVDEAMDTDMTEETKASSPGDGDGSKTPEETGVAEIEKEEEQNVLKDYAGDVMDDFLGMFGLDKLDEDEKEKLSVSDKFSSEKAAEMEKATKSVPSPKSAAAKPTSTPSAPTPPPKPAQTTAPSKSSSGGKSQGKPVQMCIVCKKVDKCKYNIVRNGDVKHLCDDNCFKTFRASPAMYLKGKESSPAPPPPTPPAPEPPVGPVMTSVEKECVVCKATSANKSKQFLAWQGMNYCSEACLGKFQGKLSKNCAYCEQEVSEAAKAKFCMSLGKEVKHFCQVACLDDFKKHLKLCAYCQTDLSKNPDSFAAPVGKGTGFKDFCSQNCLQRYEDKLFNKDKPEEKSEDGKENDGAGGVRPRTRSASGLATCAVCGKMSTIKHEVNFEGKGNKLCSDPCFAAFRYTNKLSVNKCDLCGASVSEGLNVQYEGVQKRFCSILCVNTFKVAKKKMVACAWCASKKVNFDMIERVDPSGKYQLFCTLNCLSLYRVNIQATSNQRVTCDQCRKFVPAQYHLTMSDASVRNFCSYTCVVAFQAQFNQNRKPANTPATRGKGPQQQQQPTRTVSQTTQQKLLAAQKAKATSGNVPVISNVMSLAPPGQKPGMVNSATRMTTQNQATAGTQTVVQKVMIQPPAAKPVKNKSLLCKPFTQTKATTCRPHTQTKETQTDDGDMKGKPLIIPIPVPIYVPCPAGMYSFPAPIPVPVPLPIPVPVFLPTTKNTTESIFKYMQDIQEKMPADPFEAELLMMAAAVASDESDDDEDKKATPKKTPMETKPAKQETSAKKEKVSHSHVEPTPQAQEQASSGNMMGEDMLQMALRLASEMSDPPVDLESSLDTAAKTGSVHHGIPVNQVNEPVVQERRGKGRKRAAGGGRGRSKRQRVEEEPEPPPQPVQQEPAVQPDAGLVLKYTYGVNAWKHWVLQKNQQLEKALKQNHRIKLFKTDILQCTADELNYTLCLFVKEVRKPNGEEYAPDSIYYLCLGIQMYLFENSRVDNIFTDIYYEKFTECLNEVSMRYEPRYAPTGHLICRIEEEHLWECKQLGAHSPHVLLNTLIYFNTRDFALRNPTEHLRLSFSHIMKHWKKTGTNSLCPSPTNIGSGGNNRNSGRTVYLRYYAPSANSKGNKKKKEKDDSPIYEQAENIDNPLRCPVKLYEFYLSKCPESIRNRNDVFYLVPERSCVPDSPVWYSTASLGGEAMAKMLNRLRMVKEIQESCHGAFNVGFTS